ncbi:MAG TPA: polysaccharide biosynthesis/export family protein [Polyangia bacterium]|jgi:polysaccharide export outer membrane protein|nr:polysaccharide biosynthesis/export family protein [Polyangia bacterium]
MKRFATAHFAYFLSFIFVASCAAEKPFVWAANLPAVASSGEGIIHPRDVIVISVLNQTALSGEFVVRDDGGILLPTVGGVEVAGRSPQQVTEELRARLATLVVRPVVAVSLARIGPIRVNVVGEVKSPATYELTRDRSVAAALAAAGWLTEFANRDRIFVVRSEGGLPVRFRAAEITAPTPVVSRFRLRDGDVVVVE